MPTIRLQAINKQINEVCVCVFVFFNLSLCMLKIIIVQLHVIYRERTTRTYKQQQEYVNINGKGSAFDNVIVNAYVDLMLGSLLIDGYRVIGKSQWHNAHTLTLEYKRTLLEPTVHLVNLVFAVFYTKLIATHFIFLTLEQYYAFTHTHTHILMDSL